MHKKYIVLLVTILSVTAAVFSCPQPVYATSSAVLQQQREEKEREKEQTQQQLDRINSEIGEISDEKESVEAEIEELNNQITEVLASISLMEEDARLSEEATTVRDRNTENVKERQTVQSVD